MKSYTITVNGNVYDVVVEENNTDTIAEPVKKTAAPKVAPKSTGAANGSSQGSGSIKVEAGAAGKVFKIEASVGQKMEKGDTVVIVEAMKMEIPVVAPKTGTIASIDVAVGDMIEAGQILATLN